MASSGSPEAAPGAAPEDALGPLTRDRLLGGRVLLDQPARGFRAGEDALLLAASVPARAGEAALDLGCGAGAAALALGARVGGLRLAGVEVQPAYAGLARANAALNGVALEVHEGDVAGPLPSLRGRAFDHVLMNPPYRDARDATPAPDRGRQVALAGDAPLAAWLALAARRLRPGGSLAAIQPARRLPLLLAGLPAAMGSVEVLPLAPRAGASPDLVVLRARKGGRAPFRLLAALPRREGSGRAPAISAVLNDAATLPWGD